MAKQDYINKVNEKKDNLSAFFQKLENADDEERKKMIEGLKTLKALYNTNFGDTFNGTGIEDIDKALSEYYQELFKIIDTL